jgi:hypothetical protein
MVEFKFTSDQIERLKSWEPVLDTEMVIASLKAEDKAEIKTSKILNGEKFKNGENFSSENLDELFHWMREFISNRYLSKLLYETNGRGEFNVTLRELIHGKEPIEERVHNFFNLKLDKNKHVGSTTLSHFLVASDASKYPLITDRTKKILDISSAQYQAALSDALERFEIKNKDTNHEKTLNFFRDWIIFESIKNLLNLDKYTQVNNLIWFGYKQEIGGDSPTSILPITGKIQDKLNSELNYRMQIWNQIKLKYENGINLPTDAVQKEFKIYTEHAGIYYNKERTAELSDNGVGITVSVLHTGHSYPDDVGEDSIIYHYPTTQRPKQFDMNEITATKNSKKYKLPIFVIFLSKETDHKCDVKMGYVYDWDDESRTFFIKFGESVVYKEEKNEELPFNPTQNREQIESTSKFTPRDPSFRFYVLKRYGAKCGVCSVKIENLLHAAHVRPIRPVKSAGSDDVRNGLILCHNHHSAFDNFLFSIDPQTRKIVYTTNGPQKEDLKIEYDLLTPLKNMPHTTALEWHYEKFNE